MVHPSPGAHPAPFASQLGQLGPGKAPRLGYTRPGTGEEAVHPLHLCPQLPRPHGPSGFGACRRRARERARCVAHGARGWWRSPAAPTCPQAAGQARKSQRFLRSPGPGAFSSGTGWPQPNRGDLPGLPLPGQKWGQRGWGGWAAARAAHPAAPLITAPTGLAAPGPHGRGKTQRGPDGRHPGQAQACGVAGAHWRVAGERIPPAPRG